MADAREILVPAASGVAVQVGVGEVLQVVNPHGTQVVDTWAFTDAGGEHLSMEHSREVLQRIRFGAGDRLLTNRYRTALTVLRDTSPGHHDTLIAACSPEMYAHLGVESEHPSCSENLARALAGAGRQPDGVPAPWNLFMVAEVAGDGKIEYRRPESRPGDLVELRAELDLLCVFSACPDDVYPTNGGTGEPHEALIRVLPNEGSA